MSNQRRIATELQKTPEKITASVSQWHQMRQNEQTGIEKFLRGCWCLKLRI